MLIQKHLEVIKKIFSYSNKIDIISLDHLHENYNRSQVRIEILCQIVKAPDK